MTGTTAPLPAGHPCGPATCDSDLSQWHVPVRVDAPEGVAAPYSASQRRLACSAATARHRVQEDFSRGLVAAERRRLTVGEPVPVDEASDRPAHVTPLAQHSEVRPVAGLAPALKRRKRRRTATKFAPGDMVIYMDHPVVLLDRAPVGRYPDVRPRGATALPWWGVPMPPRYLPVGDGHGASWWLQRLDGSLIREPVRANALRPYRHTCTAPECSDPSAERFGGPCPAHADPLQGAATTLFWPTPPKP